MTQPLLGLRQIIKPQSAIRTNNKTFQRSALAIAAGSLLIGAAPTQAAILTVLNNNDSGAGSLRQAISDAAAGDTIAFDASLSGSTITLSSVLTILKDLSIDGDIDDDETADVTISGNNAIQIFNISSPSSSINNLEGLIIKDGKPGIRNSEHLTIRNSTLSGNSINTSGGAIYNSAGGTLTIINSTLSENYAGAFNNPGTGGAISNQGTLSISDSLLSQNSSNNSGGAIISSNGPLSITNSTLSGNSSSTGGAINALYGPVTISDSTLSGNTAGSGGGGISQRGSTLAVVNSTLSGNSAGSGGAIVINTFANAILTLTNSTLTGNSAGGFGGAINALFSNPTLTLTATIMDSNLSMNVANNGAGAVLIGGSAYFTISNSTLSGNSTGSSTESGGAIWTFSESLTITNSTLSHNTAAKGAGLYMGSNSNTTLNNNIIANSFTGFDCEKNSFATVTLGNNLIENGSGCTGTITTDPQLGPLQDNGGDTLTHALLAGSPAIDTGIDADALDATGSPLMNDQRGSGFPRIIGTVDLGSFEFHPCKPGTLSISNTDFSTSNNMLSSETEIQVSNTVNVFNNAGLTLEAPLTHITEGFHAHAGSTVHITAMNVDCSTKSSATPNKILTTKSQRQTNDIMKSSARSSAPQALAARRLLQGQLTQSLQQLLQTAGANDIDSFYSDAFGDTIVFTTATALLLNDGNTWHDVYLYYSNSGRLELISSTPSGVSGNGASTQPRIDGAGLYIVYRSSADNLTTADTNQVADILRYAIDTGHTTRISLNADGSESSYPAQNPVIGGTEPQILYDREDISGYNQLFHYDALYNNLGAETYQAETSQTDNHHPGISADGRYISYVQTWTEAEQQYCTITIDDQDTGESVQIACPDALMTNPIISAGFSAAGELIIWYVAETPTSKIATTDNEPKVLSMENPLFK